MPPVNLPASAFGFYIVRINLLLPLELLVKFAFTPRAIFWPLAYDISFPIVRVYSYIGLRKAYSYSAIIHLFAPYFIICAVSSSITAAMASKASSWHFFDCLTDKRVFLLYAAAALHGGGYDLVRLPLRVFFCFHSVIAAKSDFDV